MLPHHFLSVQKSLGEDLHLSRSLPNLDIHRGWKLFKIGSSEVKSLDVRAFSCLRLRDGLIDLVFYSFESKDVTTSRSSAFAAKLFLSAVSVQRPIPLCMGGLEVIGFLLVLFQFVAAPIGSVFSCASVICRAGSELLTLHSCRPVLLHWKPWCS